MAAQKAELDKMAENIARERPKIYPKSTPNSTAVVITPVTSVSGAHGAPTLSVVQIGTSSENTFVASVSSNSTSTVAQQPNTPPHNVTVESTVRTMSQTPTPREGAPAKSKVEKVRKTPPHILKAKKEYYQHNRESILSKQKEYKKRIATGVKKKV